MAWPGGRGRAINLACLVPLDAAQGLTLGIELAAEPNVCASPVPRPDLRLVIDGRGTAHR